MYTSTDIMVQEERTILFLFIWIKGNFYALPAALWLGERIFKGLKRDFLKFKRILKLQLRIGRVYTSLIRSMFLLLFVLNKSSLA